jgi:hypothetical protein
LARPHPQEGQRRRISPPPRMTPPPLRCDSYPLSRGDSQSRESASVGYARTAQGEASG